MYAEQISQAVLSVVALDRKVTDADVRANLSLWPAVAAYLKQYAGSFAFLVDLKAQAAKRALSDRQIAGVLNCLVAEFRNNPERFVPQAPLPVVPVAAVSIPDGIYTVVLSGPEDYVTLRVSSKQPGWASNWTDGQQVIKRLVGPINTTDYVGVAFLNGGTFKVWKKYAGDARLFAAIERLVGGSPAEYGKAYALLSGHCARCNRVLTVPASVAGGYGPECAAVLGLAA